MIPREYSVKGKVAIVAGAGRGIGKSIALTLAEAGADVTVAARTAKQIEAMAEEIRKLGRKALAVPADVTKASDVKRVVQKTIAEFGKIDILVNSAGIDILKPIVFIPEMRKKKPPEWQVADTWDKALTEADWHEVINANLTSAFLFAQAVGPYLLKQKRGKVIYISSTSADLGAPYFSAYCASKAGLSVFTRCLASEWAPFNVCVNAVGPGTICTDLNADALQKPELKKFVLAATPLGRYGETREVALLVLFLASDAANYITGQTIFMDGGQLGRGLGI